MASKALATSLLLTLNLAFFAMVCSSAPSILPVPTVCPPCPSAPLVPIPSPPRPSMPPAPMASPPRPSTPPVPMPSPPRSSTPPVSMASPPPPASCPIDVLKLRVCANVLNSVNVTIGPPRTSPCCTLINGLVDLEAAACLCTALRTNILGINLNIPISLSLLLNNCGRNNSGYQCN